MIIQGDNGTRVKLHVKENEGYVDLSGATIHVKIKQGTRVIEKTAEITGLGTCEIVLSSDDVAEAGPYVCQATLEYQSGQTFSSNLQSFKVGEKL